MRYGLEKPGPLFLKSFDFSRPRMRLLTCLYGALPIFALGLISWDAWLLILEDAWDVFILDAAWEHNLQNNIGNKTDLGSNPGHSCCKPPRAPLNHCICFCYIIASKYYKRKENVNELKRAKI